MFDSKEGMSIDAGNTVLGASFAGCVPTAAPVLVGEKACADRANKRTAVSIGLAAASILSPVTGVTVAVNFFTAAVAVLLGLPGVVCVTALAMI